MYFKFPHHIGEETDCTQETTKLDILARVFFATKALLAALAFLVALEVFYSSPNHEYADPLLRDYGHNLYHSLPARQGHKFYLFSLLIRQEKIESNWEDLVLEFWVATPKDRYIAQADSKHRHRG